MRGSARASGARPRPRSSRIAVRAALLGLRTVRALPSWAAYAAAGLVADITWCRRGPRVQRLEDNLRAAGVDPAAVRLVSRQGMRSYLRYWCEAVRLPSWSRDQVLASVRVEGDGPVREALANGRGAVMALAHQGNWDLAGAWSGYDLGSVTTVAERLEPAEVFDGFLDFRRSLGMTVLALGDPGVLPDLMRAVKANHVVPLLIDRDLSGSGITVDFLDGRASFAAGPATLGALTGAPVFPVTIHYERVRLDRSGWPESGHRTVIHFHPAVKADQGPRAERVRRLTQACAGRLGAGIAGHPHDWHMLQPVFDEPADPSAD